MKTLKATLFWLLSWTWGIVMTLFGAIVAVGMLITGHKPHRHHWFIYFEAKFLDGCGFEAGVFFFCGPNCESIHPHECGHGLQNIIWGPLMPFVVSIPSMIRFWYREWYNKRRLQKGWPHLPSYDSIWFEGQATRWGQKYFPVEYKGVFKK